MNNQYLLWRPIDTVPTDEIDVLTWDGKYFRILCKGIHGWFDQDGRCVSEPPGAVKPTHWMPLPDSPIKKTAPTWTVRNNTWQKTP